MSWSMALCILLVFVFAAISAFFSGMETALFSLQPFQIRRLKKRNPHLASQIDAWFENPRRLLGTILLADTLANVLVIVLCLYLLGETPALVRVPFWIGAVVIFAIVVFVCDLAPKLLALASPLRLSKAAVLALYVALPVLDPLRRVLELWAERIAELLTPSASQPNRKLRDEEIETLVDLGAEEGALHPAEREMIQEILKLGDKTVKDCMTPRVDMFAIPDDLPNAQVIARLRTTPYRRVPVYGETPDDIVGLLNAPRFLLHPDVPYTEQLDPPSFVPETMKALDLLNSFLMHRQGLAIVLDEYGGTEGLITRGDVLEEIISDAAPTNEQEFYIEKLDDNRWLVSGSARLDDLSETLGVELEAEGLDTIGGLVFNHLGYLPKPGTSVDLKSLRLTIRRSTRKRIAEILIEPGPAAAATEDRE